MADIDFRAHAEPVAKALCGEPNAKLSKPGDLRFGANGSLKVSITGETAGTFADFESGAKGGLLDLIMHKRVGDRREAMAWLSENFGLDQRPSGRVAGKTVAAVYPYLDERAEPHFEVVRLEPKDFRQRRSDSDWGVKGCRILPYRLPELIEAIARENPIFIVEGEKDVDRLAKLGAPATCNAGGAGKWRAEHAAFLKGADVVILPDNDEAGRDHAQAVARSLRGIATRIRVAELPNLSRKGDVSDWFEAGGTINALYDIMEAASDWRPASAFGLTWLGEEHHHPPRKWLVKGLLGENEMSVLFAPSGGGKSFVALDLGARIAAGLDWYDHRVTRSAVLYIAGEGATGFRQRMTAWRLANDSDDVPFVMLPRAVDLYSRETSAVELVRDAMGEVAERAGIPVRLIVLDTLSRMMQGGVDSDPKDMKIFLEHVEELRRVTGTHILIVHHTGKETDRGMRGSSMLRDFADTVLEIKVPSKEEGGPHRIVVEKQKDGEEGRNYRVRLSQSVIGTDEDGEDITSCVVKHAGASETTGSEKSQRLSNRQFSALKSLTDVMVDQSEPAPGGSFPASVARVVKLDAWKGRCGSSFLSDLTAEARKKAFNRAKDDLIAMGKVGVWEGLVWPI